MPALSETGSEWIPATTIEIEVADGQMVAATKGMKGIMSKILSIRSQTTVVLHAGTVPISASINAAKTAVTDSLTNGAAAALDTLNELAAALDNNPSFATTIAAQISNRVRFDDAQTLTTTQQAQACANIGIGDPERDLAAAYTTAKA